jgi:hypothetical protein
MSVAALAGQRLRRLAEHLLQQEFRKLLIARQRACLSFLNERLHFILGDEVAYLRSVE